jgi:hypothetical protein
MRLWPLFPAIARELNLGGNSRKAKEPHEFSSKTCSEVLITTMTLAHSSETKYWSRVFPGKGVKGV